MKKLSKFREAEKKKFEQIWRQFPWIWAVHRLWRINLDTVQIQNATEEILGREPDDDRAVRYWAIVTHADGSTIATAPLRPPPRFGHSLAEETLSAFRAEYRVSHIVKRKEADIYGTGFPVCYLTIYRPKGSQDLHEMCKKIAPNIVQVA